MRPALRLVLPALAAVALRADGAASQTPAPARTPTVADARVQDLSWLVGWWMARGEAGELREEWWDTTSAPGKLKTFLRHVRPDGWRRYDNAYVERGPRGLRLRVSRMTYGPNRFPAEGRTYPLVAIAADSAVFEGADLRFTLRRLDADRVEVASRRRVAGRLRTDAYTLQRFR